MYNSVITESRINREWEDGFKIEVYENLACQEYDKFEYINQNASKKKLLNEISKSSIISVDMMIIIENIVNLNKIIIIKDEGKIGLFVKNDNDESNIIFDFSGELLEIIENL